MHTDIQDKSGEIESKNDVAALRPYRKAMRKTKQCGTSRTLRRTVLARTIPNSFLYLPPRWKHEVEQQIQRHESKEYPCATYLWGLDNDVIYGIVLLG